MGIRVIIPMLVAPKTLSRSAVFRLILKVFFLLSLILFDFIFCRDFGTTSLMLPTDRESVNCSWAKTRLTYIRLKSPDSNLEFVTSVIQFEPLRSYRILNSSFYFIRYPTSLSGFFIVSLIRVFYWHSAFLCDYQATQDESWGLTFMFLNTTFRVFSHLAAIRDLYILLAALIFALYTPS